ncbi:MAG: hypothetical protein N2555_04690 [Endomicrobia bacterium]|nr:hypothetical protein [Endomicrobiia bacterium]
MKKLLVFCFLFFVPCWVYYIKPTNYIFSPLNNTSSVINISLTFFGNYTEKSLTDIELLKSLFVETAHKNFAKEELASFKSLSGILEKPFSSFWIIAKGVVKQFYYEITGCINDARKIVLPILRILVNITLPFILLFYFKTRLETHRSAPMVLRC